MLDGALKNIDVRKERVDDGSRARVADILKSGSTVIRVSSKSTFEAEIEASIAEVVQLQDNPQQKLQLTLRDRERLLQREAKMAVRLERIIRSNSRKKLDVRLDYFLTTEGRALLAAVANIDTVTIPTDKVGLRAFFYRNGKCWARLTKQQRHKLEHVSHTFSVHKLLDQLEVDHKNGLQVANVEGPEQLTLLLSTRKKTKRIIALRKFKLQLKGNIRFIKEKSSVPNDYEKARLAVYDIYLRRVNELIAQAYSDAYSIVSKEKTLGRDALSDDERMLLSLLPGGSNVSRAVARWSRFIQGRDQYRDLVCISRQSKVIDRDESEATQVAGMGLNLERLRAKVITPEQRKMWAERALQHYTATQGWKYVTEAKRKSLVVDGRNLKIRDGEMNTDVITALGVLLEHEIGGHVTQRDNREQLPLAIFRRIKGDRSILMAEAGAVAREEAFMLEAFGLKRSQSLAYVAAIQAKVEGRGYLGAVKAFFDCRFEDLKRFHPDLSTMVAQREIEQLMRVAINRVERIFRDIDIMPGDTSPHIPNAKDLVYIERQVLMQKLKREGLERLAFLGGMNLKNAALLLRLGMLELDSIHAPHNVTMAIWNEIKADYLQKA